MVHVIPIEREFNFYMSKPYSNCEIDNNSPSASLFESELYSIISYSKYQYSQELCFYQCKYFKN